MTVCVPTCPEGTLPKPGMDGFSTQCIQCPGGSPIISGGKGNWVCRRGGRTTLPLRSIDKSYRLRKEIDGGCPAGKHKNSKAVLSFLILFLNRYFPERI